MYLCAKRRCFPVAKAVGLLGSIFGEKGEKGDGKKGTDLFSSKARKLRQIHRRHGLRAAQELSGTGRGTWRFDWGG